MERVRWFLILSLLIGSVGSIAAQRGDGHGAAGARLRPIAQRTVDDPGEGSGAAGDITFIDSLRSRSYGGGRF